MMRQLICILLITTCTILINTVPVHAQDAVGKPPQTSAEPPAVTKPVQIDFREVESSLNVGADRNAIYLRIALRVSVTNTSDQPVPISRSQFELFTAGKSIEAGLIESNPSLPTKELMPGESTEGYIWFAGLLFKGDEPPLELVWTHRDTRITAPDPPQHPSGDDAEEDNSPTPDDPPKSQEKDVDSKDEPKKDAPPTPTIRIALNEVLRRLNTADIDAIGPDGCLIQISVGRLQDTVASWSMARILEDLHKTGHQRILIVPKAGQKALVMDEYVTWLSGLVEGSNSQNVVNLPLPKLTARFKSIAVANVPQAPNRRFYGGRRSVKLYESVDDAVTEALMPLYRFVPVEDALSDLRSPIAGIRRAAIAGVVDRLTEEQAQMILEKVLNGDEQTQLLIVSYLNLIPGKGSVETLRALSQSPNSKVAAAAVQTLSACPDDAAIAAMADVWKTSESHPDMRSVILTAIKNHPDERWVPLAKDYVISHLEKSSQPGGPDLQPQSIADALSLLKDLERVQMAKIIENSILTVRSRDLQDTLLSYLLSVDFPNRSQIIRQVVDQRVTENQLSGPVMNAAMLFPNSAWTPALLAAGKSSKTPNGVQSSLRPALACANESQLDEMVSEFDSLGQQQQLELLSHLAKTEHKGWQGLAGKVLDHKNRSSIEVVQLLVNDASEESLQVLREQLVKYVKELEGTKDASVEGSQYFARLGLAVAIFSDPECRRTINRLRRDPNEHVANAAKQWHAMDYRNSPAWDFIRQEIEARQAGKSADVEELINKRLDADPFLADNYVRRASEHMHKGRFKESMEDLQKADKLSPEDIEVLSLMAIVKVRLGETDGGLKMADELIVMAPRDWTAVYNGACSYSRATENDIPSEKKQEYADKAIQLIENCAKGLTFRDFEHMQKDEDLVALHNHPKWAATVELVKSNQSKDPP